MIKGPVGKGIITNPNGLHVAFAAGTGVLTFMDTVALAARVAIKKAKVIKESFRIQTTIGEEVGEEALIDLPEDF